MPFDLVNSQSSYQRLMDATLRHVDHAEPYIDDICVHSSTFEQHLNDLESTLQALEGANIQLRIEKCNFYFPRGGVHWSCNFEIWPQSNPEPVG